MQYLLQFLFHKGQDVHIGLLLWVIGLQPRSRTEKPKSSWWDTAGHLADATRPIYEVVSLVLTQIIFCEWIYQVYCAHLSSPNQPVEKETDAEWLCFSSFKSRKKSRIDFFWGGGDGHGKNQVSFLTPFHSTLTLIDTRSPAIPSTVRTTGSNKSTNCWTLLLSLRNSCNCKCRLTY